MNEHLQEIFVNFEESAETTLVDRFRAVIDEETSKTRRWKELEDLTGTAAHSWKNAYSGTQRPTAEMVEAIAQQWPKYAFWLITGITDLSAQHLCPSNACPWPGSVEELEEAAPNSAWRPLIKLKPEIGKFLGEEELPLTEQIKLETEFTQLGFALDVNKTLQRLKWKEKIGATAKKNK